MTIGSDTRMINTKTDVAETIAVQLKQGAY
jgi:hypothetical protein